MVRRRVALAVAMLSLVGTTSAAPLNDPVLLNIGFVCRWEHRCVHAQRSAMKSGLTYVKASPATAKKVQLCNRNASRGGTRKDWVGFNNCIRNPAIKSARSRR
jgi:hypothetical protein